MSETALSFPNAVRFSYERRLPFFFTYLRQDIFRRSARLPAEAENLIETIGKETSIVYNPPPIEAGACGNSYSTSPC